MLSASRASNSANRKFSRGLEEAGGGGGGGNGLGMPVLLSAANDWRCGGGGGR